MRVEYVSQCKCSSRRSIAGGGRRGVKCAEIMNKGEARQHVSTCVEYVSACKCSRVNEYACACMLLRVNQSLTNSPVVLLQHVFHILLFEDCIERLVLARETESHQAVPL
jgi:hypothetical protein